MSKCFSEQVSAVQLYNNYKSVKFFWTMPAFGFFLKQVNFLLTAKKKKRIWFWNSLVVQWLRLCTSTAGGMISIPGWGTKIPVASWCDQKKIFFLFFFFHLKSMVLESDYQNSSSGSTLLLILAKLI